MRTKNILKLRIVKDTRYLGLSLIHSCVRSDQIFANFCFNDENVNYSFHTLFLGPIRQMFVSIFVFFLLNLSSTLSSKFCGHSLPHDLLAF